MHLHRKKGPTKKVTNPIQKMAKKLSESITRKKSAPAGIQLRYMEELPEPAMDLITNLMEPKMEDRLSVREAQDHKWVGGYDLLPHGDVPSHSDDAMVHLKSAL